MASAFVTRIKSAAFIRRSNWQDVNPEAREKYTLVTNVPISESRFSYLDKNIHLEIARINDLSKLKTSKINTSRASQIWRIVHSTKSEFRLKSLNSRLTDQEPIRLNLSQKVERIKLKHLQRQSRYQNSKFWMQKKKVKRPHTRIQSNLTEKGQIEKKIHEILKQIEGQKKLTLERHRTRLLKMAKK